MKAILPCILVVALSAACGGDDTADAATTDSGMDADTSLPPGVTPSPDGEGFCCAPGEPRCECSERGGFVTDPTRCDSTTVCDAPPPAWRRTTDEHGCDTYEVGGGDGCFPPIPDAATDADTGMDGSEDGSFDAGSDAGTFAFDVRIDFANFAADPPGNWVLLPAGTMGTLVTGLIDFDTGVSTPISLNSDAGWISTGGAAANWTMGDVDWLPEVVAQDAWGGHVDGNVVELGGVAGAVRVEVVTTSGFPDSVRRVTVNGTTTTTTFRGRSGVDSAAWDAQADGTNQGDWLVWPRVIPAGGLIEVRITPGIVSAIRLSPAI